MKRDPQNDVDVPQKFVDKADQMIQDRIETSVDEERYTNGDMTEEIYELAAESWAEDEENKKIAAAERAIEMDKENRL